MQFTVVFAVVFAVLVGMISAMPQFGGPGRFFRPGPIIRPPFGRPGGVQTTITKTQSIPNYRGGVTTISKALKFYRTSAKDVIAAHIIGDTGVDGHTMEAIIIIITTDLEAGEVHQQAHNGDSGVDGHTMEVSEVITTDLAAGEPLHHQDMKTYIAAIFLALIAFANAQWGGPWGGVPGFGGRPRTVTTTRIVQPTWNGGRVVTTKQVIQPARPPMMPFMGGFNSFGFGRK